jgi:hypothetical protein
LVMRFDLKVRRYVSVLCTLYTLVYTGRGSCLQNGKFRILATMCTTSGEPLPQPQHWH